MKSLEVKYLGLTLKNPVVVSSSGLTSTVDNIKKMEAAGAGAVVLKSLFQEQITHEAQAYEHEGDYPEAHDYIMSYAVNNSVEEYLKLIREAKQAVSIPIIASINCTSVGEWVSFAKRIEAAGADALELNIYFLASNKDMNAAACEAQYLGIAAKLRSIVTIPISVKMPKTFTNIPHMVDQLYYRKINGVVLFNRFYEPDINVETMKVESASVFSSPSDIRESLRWVGIVSAAVPLVDVAASTGIHSGEAAIKQLLAGAAVVEVCSVLYKKGPKAINEILEFINGWMGKHHYKSIEEFRGKMNPKNLGSLDVYERSQFMRYYSSHE
ncbi:dihydroorotate dehydrogenase-like protein [Acetobacteroides hydrogenigenes]|uniref:Dihydroorotate dehydrogenase (Fumarate) n=1 Tax=Acetobacteroides hydrogenigenes TaxID=979970 RepID=A0A4R2F0U4_9BACT|nr:dihydroorotate dehydrogenase-like protein [Acetobacteroides hydrogenigenes]TCN70599.1 dihydroorotate dehydrogenase (fumarate) [Acetobacteroides hydrogenigenes]